MHVLFLHQNFPAQFRYIAPRLVQDYGWQCSFMTANDQGSLPGVSKLIYRCTGGATKANHFASRNFENTVNEAHAVFETLKYRQDLRPDLIVAHTGFGSSLFLPYLYDAPLINFVEYFYRPVGQDIGFRPEMPVTEESLLRVKTKNAMILLDLENCDRGWTATHYQRDFFPAEFRSKIDVIFDGIDTGIYYRRLNRERRLPSGQVIPKDTRIVTYVARGFERMRGFDVFMEVARRTYEQYPNVLFVVVGADSVHYGPDLAYTDKASFREEVLSSGRYDLSKFFFTGWVSENDLAEILSVSDLHIYLTEPFIASWSLVNAMSCGAVVLASDQRCVREYIRPGENGLLRDFFDVEGLATEAVRVLRDPAEFRPLSLAAQETVQHYYSVEVAMPRLKAYFEQVASKPREPSLRLEHLVREGTVREPIPAEDAQIKKDALRKKSSPAAPITHPPATATTSPATVVATKVTPKRTGGLLKRPPVRGASPALDAALDVLEEMCRGRTTSKDWIELCCRFSASSPFESFGPLQHHVDLMRLMQRVIEWAPKRVLDLGSRGYGTPFLWSRCSAGDARIVVMGTTDQPLDESRRPLIEAFACEAQTLHFLPTVSGPEALAKELEQRRGFRKYDFVFMNGQRPAADLVEDYNVIVKFVRPGALIAWDGVRASSNLDPQINGGTLLWQELKPRFARHAEYLDGRDSSTGAIVAVVVP